MEKEVKSPEKSLSYIAWSIKEMAENIKKIAEMMATHYEEMAKSKRYVSTLDERMDKRVEERNAAIKRDEIPF